MKTLIEIVKKELNSSSHDFDHTLRVLNLALKIVEHYPEVDLEVLKVSCILHDIARVREDADPTHTIDHAELGAEMSKEILKSLGYKDDFISKVSHAIRAHRFRGKILPETIEAKILSDADKLDAIGAIGVARAFIIAGEYGERLYVEVNEDNFKEAKRINNFKEHSPNIEYLVKLRYIKDRLYTDYAKEIAEDRLRYMEEFFERLKREVRGEL
ncbi:HD domain-containing protein [Caldisericum exile]|uniref:HD domain-containing protein n=1 Tax=Caldisericum exile (strain DSM 21853 / NBRC 104410 / AZM16c01) TaxID=511051 RepID=A0A7U6JEK8_CALEA|nr:HD domain-containing protein [Caldisericum exile]BAL80826.1 hypothetical protein CSE_07000 [Caldisericum exile AZM16c01]